MARPPVPALACAALLMACQPQAPLPEAPARADLSSELVRLRSAGPPKGPAGACWHRDVTPAIIETTTEQIALSPEERSPEGRVIRPAAFRTATHQRIVQDREEVWLRTLCPADLTVDFIATLQRALKARGLYLLPLTGAMDAPTRAAIRRFQADRGLDSDTLSLAAARDLGIVSTDLTAL